MTFGAKKKSHYIMYLQYHVNTYLDLSFFTVLSLFPAFGSMSSTFETVQRDSIIVFDFRCAYVQDLKMRVCS